MKIYVSLIILMLSLGVAKGLQDAIQFHTSSFFEVFENANPNFWGPPSSTWQNKYEVGSTSLPKFFGSTTFFVAFTDSWHLLELIKKTIILLVVFVVAKRSENPRKPIIACLVALLSYHLGFIVYYLF